jgi:hypothetical protein
LIVIKVVRLDGLKSPIKPKKKKKKIVIKESIFIFFYLYEIWLYEVWFIHYRYII